MGIVKSNPFPRDHCGRIDCLVCYQKDQNQAGLACDKSNVGYEGRCKRCTTTPFAYIGETSRTAYTRMKEHFGNYRAAATAQLPAQPQLVYQGVPGNREKPPKSWMWEHVREHHSGEVGDDEGKGDFEIKVAGVFKKCLQRQVDEDCRMQEFEGGGGVLLNSKNEYYTPKSIQTVFRQM